MGDIIRQPPLMAIFTFLGVMLIAFVQIELHLPVPSQLPDVAAPIGRITTRMVATWPHLSMALSCLLLLTACMVIGRNTVRAEIYVTRCFLAMPLFGTIGCCLLLSNDFLTLSLTLLLLVLASRNFYNSFHRHYCFERIFRGALYAGLIPLVYAPGALFLILIPIVAKLFRRTLRELIVALTGMLLPLFYACFIHWALGGAFAEPLLQIADAFMTDAGYSLIDNYSPFALVAWGLILFLLICSIASFAIDYYTLRTKQRNILLYNLYLLFIVIGIYFVPGTTSVTPALIAPAAATLIPVGLLKFNQTAAALFYLVLIAMSVTACLV